MSACRQCRARKVRCDRRPARCGPCTRLSLPCSYGGGSLADASGNAPGDASSAGLFLTLRRDDFVADQYTEAGLRRLRSRQACAGCRAVKARCAGGIPCVRCRARRVVCEGGGGGEGAPGQYAEAPPTEAGALPEPSPALPGLPAPPGLPGLSGTSPRTCIDAFFDAGTGGLGFPFLLKSLVLSDWTAGTLPPLLLQCIVATGLYYRSIEERDDNGNHSLTTARAWIDDAQSASLGPVGLAAHVTLGAVQTLVLIARFCLLTGQQVRAWHVVAVAARMAFALALNEEVPERAGGGGPAPARRETRRRTMWAIYMLDRLFSGGVDDLAVCPPERMRVRLPCDQQSFQHGIPSRAEFLEAVPDAADAPAADTARNASHDPLAYYLRLLADRHRILRYTKRLRRMASAASSDATPSSSDTAADADELAVLRRRLVAAEQALPAHLQNTPANLVLLSHSPDAAAFLALHTLLLQCHCDLHRHAVPGLREALPAEALARCTPAYLHTCRRACLDAALRLCRLWAAARRLDYPVEFHSALFAVSVYQVAQIVLRLRHVLPRTGPAAPKQLAQSLRAALGLVNTHSARFDPARLYIRDVWCLIPALDRVGETDCVPEAELEAAVESEDINGRPYMPSRYSFIESICRADADEPEASPRDAVTREAQASQETAPTAQSNSNSNNSPDDWIHDLMASALESTFQDLADDSAAVPEDLGDFDYDPHFALLF